MLSKIKNEVNNFKNLPSRFKNEILECSSIEDLSVVAQAHICKHFGVLNIESLNEAPKLCAEMAQFCEKNGLLLEAKDFNRVNSLFSKHGLPRFEKVSLSTGEASRSDGKSELGSKCLSFGMGRTFERVHPRNSMFLTDAGDVRNLSETCPSGL